MPRQRAKIAHSGSARSGGYERASGLGESLGGLQSWSCHHPRVNRSSPAFLAGRATAAKRCEDERRNVVGQCGTRGRLFAPRAVPALPVPDADA